MKTAPTSDLQLRTGQLVADIEDGQHIVLTRYGKPLGVVVPADWYHRQTGLDPSTAYSPAPPQMGTDADIDTVIADLHADLDNISDLTRRAALLLLLRHDYWPRNGHFRRTAIRRYEDGGHTIDWREARRHLAEGTYSKASSSELAMLTRAIDVATDRCQVSILGNVNRLDSLSAEANAYGYKVVKA